MDGQGLCSCLDSLHHHLNYPLRACVRVAVDQQRKAQPGKLCVRKYEKREYSNIKTNVRYDLTCVLDYDILRDWPIER